MFCFKMANQIFVLQNLKNTFPKEFLIEIWHKVEEHEYIYIFDIKFLKNYSD